MSIDVKIKIKIHTYIHAGMRQAANDKRQPDKQTTIKVLRARLNGRPKMQRIPEF